MKKFLTTTGIKQLLLGAMVVMLVLSPFQPLIAQAQTVGPTPEQAGKVLTNNGSSAVANTDFCVGGVGGCLANIIYVFTVGIGSVFAYVAATFFNIAVNLSLNGPIYALTFISTGWTTARDLANMTFLFILIYIAFMIILEADTSGTMSLLAGVIVIALLVNFSFFFTRLVIDAGNILSIEFYNSIPAPPIQGTANSGGVSGAVTSATTFATNATAGVTGGNTKDLTASIMGMLNLQGLFNNSSFQQFTKDNNFMVQFITLSFLYIAAAILLWMLTITFITAGIKFLVRIVVLWFLIIASPLAFVARAMPAGKFRGYFDTWREMLVAHAFYPVAFMFIFLILTNFTNQMGQSGNLINSLFGSLNNQSGSGIVNIAISIANAAISLGFVIIILYMGLKAADSISVMSGKAAESAGNSFGNIYSRFMGKGSAGAVGWAGRNTVGAAGNSFARNLTLRKWEAEGGVKGVVARGIRGAGAATAGASFDARALAGKGAKDIVGEAQKGGYTKETKDAVHAKEEVAKDLEPNAGDKSRAHAIIEQEAKAGNTERGREYSTFKTAHDSSKKRSDAIDHEIENLKEAQKTSGLDNSASIRILNNEKKGHQAAINKNKKKMENLEKKITGEGLKKDYANTLVSKRAGNLWGTFMRANREAADHIRHEQSKDKKLADAVKEFTKGDEHTAEPAAPAAAAHAPAPTAAAHAPAPAAHAPTGGDHGGGGHAPAGH